MYMYTYIYVHIRICICIYFFPTLDLLFVMTLFGIAGEQFIFLPKWLLFYNIFFVFYARLNKFPFFIWGFYGSLACSEK